MASTLPKRLAELLEAAEATFLEEAWGRFVERYSPDILSATRFLSSDEDGAMDRYSYVLEELRREDFRRLRAYSADPRARFSTWLVVVARRLCYDYDRKRYGRARSMDTRTTLEGRETRRRLTDLAVEELDPSRVEDRAASSPERQLRESELEKALESALAGIDAESRLLVKLRFEDGIPVSQIARVMQLPSPFHVYRKLKRVLAFLRDRLEVEGVHDPYP